MDLVFSREALDGDDCDRFFHDVSPVFEQPRPRSNGNDQVPDSEILVTNELFESTVNANDAMRVVRRRTERLDARSFISFGDQNADAAHIYLTDTSASTIIRDGRTSLAPSRKALETAVEDLRPNLHWRADHALDMLSFVAPRAALDRWADEAGIRPFGGLVAECQTGVSDEVIVGFGLAILPCLDRPDTAPRLFVDQVLNAVCGYLVRSFGINREPNAVRGGLAPWQARRAKELISENLGNQLSLQMLASECRLSVSHFTKAFRETVGESPHQWLLERRIDQAKTLLVTSALSLSEVGTACGFADQSHFSRSFAKRSGISPGAWRRANSNMPD